MARAPRVGRAPGAARRTIETLRKRVLVAENEAENAKKACVAFSSKQVALKTAAEARCAELREEVRSAAERARREGNTGSACDGHVAAYYVATAAGRKRTYLLPTQGVRGFPLCPGGAREQLRR